MTLFTGYKLKGQDVNHIELIFTEIKKKIEVSANAEYKKLLTGELETLIDDIALNMTQRPTDISLIDAAKNKLNNKIAYASSHNIPTKFNFEVSAHVMFFKDDTYIKFNAVHNIYKNEIGRIRGLEYFPCTTETENEKIWTDIVKRYSDGLDPFGIRLFAKFKDIEPETMKFDSPIKRAKVRARHNLTNRYLGMYSCGQQIPNYKLMEYMDEAFEALTELHSSADELRQMEIELQKILPKITTELITAIPSETTTKAAHHNDTQSVIPS